MEEAAARRELTRFGAGALIASGLSRVDHQSEGNHTEPALRAPWLNLLAACLVACSTPSDTPAEATQSPAGATPDYLHADKGCAVVAGGAIGSRFSDPKVTRLWHKVNASVTSELYDRLAASQHKVVKLVVPTEEAQNHEKLVIAAIVRYRCSRLLQISHTVDEDAAGKFFRFDVRLMRLAPTGDRLPGATDTNVKTVGEFRRDYRFPRTVERLDGFYTGTFADTVFADLTRSGSLAPLR